MTSPAQLFAAADYEPSSSAHARQQVEEYEASDGERGNTMLGKPVIILSSIGARSGKVRKTPLMRVEHDGKYLVVASKGGAPENPVWYFNLKAEPRVQLQEGARKQDMLARELSGQERAEWWDRAVAEFPNYAEYQRKTERTIPVFLLEPLEVS